MASSLDWTSRISTFLLVYNSEGNRQTNYSGTVNRLVHSSTQPKSSKIFTERNNRLLSGLAWKDGETVFAYRVLLIHFAYSKFIYLKDPICVLYALLENSCSCHL